MKPANFPGRKNARRKRAMERMCRGYQSYRHSDHDYTESAMSKETVLIVATLKVFLKGKS
jgi:hypothetical protein